jgi:hypothetical protein
VSRRTRRRRGGRGRRPKKWRHPPFFLAYFQCTDMLPTSDYDYALCGLAARRPPRWRMAEHAHPQPLSFRLSNYNLTFRQRPASKDHPRCAGSMSISHVIAWYRALLCIVCRICRPLFCINYPGGELGGCGGMAGGGGGGGRGDGAEGRTAAAHHHPPIWSNSSLIES